MRFRALFLDLDGTLLVGEVLPTDNRDALRAASNAGYRIVIATARWKEAALSVAAEIGVSDPVLACSGAQVHDPEDATDCFDERLPADFTQALFTLCNAQRCIATATFESEVLVKLDGDPDPARMPPPLRATRQLPMNRLDLPRIVAVQGRNACARIRADLAEPFADQVNFLDSIGPTGKLILTLTARSATKGTALAAACAHMGISSRQAIAFGDADNDLAMFAEAGASVAMGQASPTVLAAASYISKPHDQGGVAHAVYRLLDRGSLDP